MADPKILNVLHHSYPESWPEFDRYVTGLGPPPSGEHIVDFARGCDVFFRASIWDRQLGDESRTRALGWIKKWKGECCCLRLMLASSCVSREHTFDIVGSRGDRAKVRKEM